nr:hypothetical protein [Tanacetum cinerariifolium]
SRRKRIPPEMRMMMRRSTQLRSTLSHYLYIVLWLGCLFEPRHPYHFFQRQRIQSCDDQVESQGTIYFLSTTTYCTSTYQASVAMLRAATSSTYILASRSGIPPLGTPPLLPIPSPTSSPPFLLPSMSHIVNVLEGIKIPSVLLLNLSKLGHSSIDSFQGRRCYLYNSLCWVYPDILNARVRHNLLRGGNSASGMSSLWLTGGGINSDAGSGGSGGDGNVRNDKVLIININWS